MATIVVIAIHYVGVIGLETHGILEKRVIQNLFYCQVSNFIKCLRPKQWSKNLLVLGALLFSISNVTLTQVLEGLTAFILFCLGSGSIYILNDFVDRELDRLHPQKCRRPMASGELNPYAGLFLGIVLALGTCMYAFTLRESFGLVLVTYLVINIAYSLKLKNVVLLDIMAIAFGFVLRAVGGGLAIGVQLTPWFLLCTLLLALFLAIGKRRHELHLLANSKGVHRPVLLHYSTELLDKLSGIVTTATIMSYALYTFTSGKPVELMLTIPLVIYGIFRYLYLIHVKGQGGAPEKILLEDKPILFTVLLYGATVLVILNTFS
ncbi:decaprenyl-phosphate phosphoribosyltransferase [Sporomusa ovata]|nr:decaprenyl-phosphate phosphoribosyltransferase [Sporomusa ovata]